MIKLVDAECIRHIHTDSKDAFYLGAITADIRASDMAFQKDNEMHTIYLSKVNLGITNAVSVIQGVYSVVYDKIRDKIPEGKVITIYEDTYNDIHNVYTNPYLVQYAIHFTREDIKVECLTRYQSVPKFIIECLSR